MKILFAYNRPRGDVWKARKDGLVPDELMFGLDHFLRAGVDAEFFDDVFEPPRFDSLFRFLERRFSGDGRFVGFSLGRAIKLARLADRYDLVVAWGDSTALPLLMLKRLGRFDTPVVYSSVGLAWLLEHRRWTDSFIRFVVGGAELIVHYGWAEGEVLRSRLALAEPKVRFTPFCVDTDFFSDLAARGVSSGGKLLALGRDRSRDWETLFEAVGGSGVRVKLVCPREAVEHLRIPLEIEWSPDVPFWELKGLIASAKAVILPVVENPYTAATITMLEAMAAGRAVVVSRTQAISRGYGFEPNRELIYVKPGDPKMLRDAIERVAFDFEFCRGLARRARDVIVARNSMKVWVDEWRGIFGSCGKR